MFVVREDLAEDAFVTDCPTLASWVSPNWSLVNVQDDEDLDLVFSGLVSYAELVLTPFNAMIRDGENGFVFDTASAFAGPIPRASSPLRRVTADFNGDGRLDIFSGNTGVDFMGDAGAEEEMRSLTGRSTVPQILIDGRPIGGYTELVELDMDGELQL